VRSERADPETRGAGGALEPPPTDGLFGARMLHGARNAAVEWFERLLPAAGGCDPALQRGEAGDSRSIRLGADGTRHPARARGARGS